MIFFRLRNMRKLTLCIFCLMFGLQILAQRSAIFFTENKHQWDDNIRFRCQLYKGYLYAEQDGLTYYFLDEKNSKPHHGSFSIPQETIEQQLKEFMETGEQTIPDMQDHEKPDSLRAHAYKVLFTGMNKKVRIQGERETGYTENYMTGNDPHRWATNVKSFNGVNYENIYKNIDLHLYGNTYDLKYDYIIHPGGNPQSIKMEYTYVPSMKVGSDGALVITTSVNEVYEQKPFAYQLIENDTIEIPCSYKLDNFTVSYELGNYNKNYDLYIDPELIFSTYSGSTADNWGFTATYDSENNVYLGGIVDGFGYPISMGAIQTEYAGGNWDIGIIKLDATGENRLYATYLGGSSSEMPHSFIVNSSNELLILGTTGSADFPIVDAIQPTFMGGKNILYDNLILFENGVDMFLARISPDGTKIESSTFLGGSENDGINFSWETNLEYGHDSLYYNYGDGARGEIMIDDEDNIYIASTTFSQDFPIVNGYQTTSGGSQDGIACKFDPSLKTMEWSTYIGGDSKDAAYSIDVDKGSAFVTGGTCSSSLQIPSGGYKTQRIGGTVDAFLLQLDKNDGSLVSGTYFGSTSYDQAHFVRINSEGNVFLFGQTTASGSTLIHNAKYNTPNSGQFLASFSHDLSTLNWSTVFGSGSGTPNISPTAFEVDICNRIYLAGVGREWNDNPMWYQYGSTDYYIYDYGWYSIQGTKGMDITEDAYQKETDGKDFYIMVIDDEANNLDYGTYFGEFADGSILYNPTEGYAYFGCRASGRDHVDGGTSRFDAKGYIYQSVCASCGGCNGFPIYPNPGVWSTTNNSSNCNSAVLRLLIDFGLITSDFNIPEVGCSSKELTFKNTTQIHYNNPHVTYTWDFGDGTTSNEYSPSHTYDKIGSYTITLYVEDSTACNQRDSVTKEFSIATKVNYETLETQNICLGDSVLIGIPNEYDESLEYSWSPSTWMSDPSQPSTYTYPEDTTTFQLTVTSGWCQTVYEQTVNTFNENYFIREIETSQDDLPKIPQICRGEKIRLTAKTNAPTQRFLWSTDREFKKIVNPDFSLDYIDIVPKETTTYYVKTLSKFCEFEAIDSILVEVYYNEISAIGDTLICAGDIVSISVETPDEDANLIYEWSPQHVIKAGKDKETAFVNPKSTTDFVVLATDIIGCQYTDTVHVEVDELILNIDNYQPISCHGEQDAHFEISAIGYEPYQYLWDDSSTVVGRYNVGPGEYTVTVSDSLGCRNTITIGIQEPDVLLIDSILSTNQTCKGICNGTLKAFVSGGTEPYRYEWSDGSTTASIKNICPRAFYLKVTDAHGCVDSISKPVKIILEEKLPVVDAYADIETMYLGQETYIHACENPVDSIRYIWTPDIWLEDNMKAVTKVTPDIPIALTFKVVAIDTYGCQNSDTVRISVGEWICDDPFIFIPTAFTPNNDGNNDVIQVKSGVLSSLEFAIFDRWGEKVFETDNTQDTWDGLYHGKPLEPQVFVYYLKAVCLNGEEIERKGNITLIR